MFFGCFHFTNFFYRDCFLSGTSFLCCCTASATDLRELSRVFYFTLLPGILHNMLLSRLLLEPIVLPWRLQGLPLWLETQTRSICLFESRSVQQKVFVGRFYLRVKTLRNTISTSSRFWTHYLIAICTIKLISYPLGHRNS